MHNLFLFIRKFYSFFLFLFLEVGCLILIARANAPHRATIVNSANRVTGAVYETRREVTGYFGLREVNEELKHENARLRMELARMQTLADSGWVDTLGLDIYTYIPATVINHSVHRKMNNFTLDKGAADGLAEGMGVIDGRGLIGILTNTSANYAVGISLLNSRTYVSVKHKKSGAIGIMRWKPGSPFDFQVDDITRTAGVQPGDTLVTSGFSTFFPEGLPVARVERAEVAPGGNFYTITARTTNDILSPDKVYVVGHSQRPEIDSLERAAL